MKAWNPLLLRHHPDHSLPSRGRTFQSTSSGAAYVGGICSLSRGGGVNEVSTQGPSQDRGLLRHSGYWEHGDILCSIFPIPSMATWVPWR